MKAVLKKILQININTIVFNFMYFDFRNAIKFPVLVSKYVSLKKLNGVVSIHAPYQFGMIKIGYECVGIFDYSKSRSIIEIEGQLIFKGKAFLGQGTKISIQKDGILELGHNFYITAESAFVVTKNIKFGNGCLLSWDILLMDSDLHSITNQNGEVLNKAKEIIIGDSVWIGCRSLILKGSEIASHSVIAANSTVSGKKLDIEYAIYAGNPIAKIKDNIKWS